MICYRLFLYIKNKVLYLLRNLSLALKILVKINPKTPLICDSVKGVFKFIIMNKEELFKPVLGYEGLYEVSNKGVVRSVFYKNRIKIMQGTINSKGYLTVNLSKNRIVKNVKIHRLVCMAFNENPKNKIMVNHKNCIKTDNNSDNLEWCSSKENVIHAFMNNRYKRKLKM